ncbi:unnamed protein product [Periconia digitata]|uniref:4'-phosphopantetheinyl transferase domain-containing protein n=1 Tax=Periconia digitata TaxID=1303443 RepID=A0A9W4ULI6_9PLEO|nr:unnamed protein product [Periconia digitata]
MPPRPFPFPFRVGTDICNISRIRKIIAPTDLRTTTRLERFLPKLLTWPERQYFWNRFGTEPSPKHADAIAQFLAGRWAAKEACRKACEHLGTSNGFHSIMILPVSTETGLHSGATSRPQGLILRDRLADPPVFSSKASHPREALRRAEFILESIDGQFCEISISHDTDWAVASAIAPTLDT